MDQSTTIDIGSVVLSTVVPIRPTFASLKIPRPWFYRLRLCNWKLNKERLGRFFSFCLDTIDFLHKLGIKITQKVWLHVLRQCIIITTLTLLIKTITKYKSDPEKTVMPLLSSISLVAYGIFQNVYFCFLHGKVQLEACWKTKEEALHATSIFYSLLGFLCCTTLWLLAKETLGYGFYFGYVFASVIIFQLLADGHVPQLLCLASFILALGTLTILFVSFSAGYFFHFVVCRKCEKVTEKVQSERKKQRVSEILEKVSAPYYNNGETGVSKVTLCAICLQELGERPVVVLDCSESHVFHTECMNEWLCRANMCPMCRAVVIPEELYSV